MLPLEVKRRDRGLNVLHTWSKARPAGLGNSQEKKRGVEKKKRKKKREEMWREGRVKQIYEYQLCSEFGNGGPAQKRVPSNTKYLSGAKSRPG